MTTPFALNPHLTRIAIAYRNPAHTLIADDVIPEASAPVATKSFQYREYDLAEGFTVPDTKVGRLGDVGQVHTSSILKPDTVQDYGIEEPVPVDDITQGQAQGLDPLGDAAAYCQDIILLDKERRVASLTFDPANYPADNKLALTGADRFSDPASDPIRVLTEIMDGMMLRPNVVTFGQSVWTKLKMHPKVVKAIFPNGDGDGVVTRAQIAELLEIQKILVGASWINEARKGQEAAFNRVWGNHIQLQHQNPMASTQRGVTWAMRSRFGKKVAGTYQATTGLRGSTVVRVGESVKETIFAPHAAFLIQNAVAAA